MTRKKGISQSGQGAIRFSGSIEALAEAAKTCRACDIWSRATQTVFGEGNARAEVMFVGEQPGNQEDLTGHPFVGPAGKLLDKALLAAGIARDKVYITNVVKHFNSTQRGKWRIHKRPNAEEIAACRPWLDAEIAMIRPTVVVCLGASAAQTLISRDYRVTRQRGASKIGFRSNDNCYRASVFNIEGSERRRSAPPDARVRCRPKENRTRPARVSFR